MKKGRSPRCGRLSHTLTLTAIFVCLTVAADANILKTFDLYPSFFHCFQVTDTQQRARLFYNSVIQTYPEIYGRHEIFETKAAALNRYLEEVRAYLPAIRKVHTRLVDESEPIEQSFCRHFPDFHKSRVIIYFMLSGFRFDGKIPHDSPRALFLGLDGLAKLHGDNVNLGVILSHELFHLYHFQVNPLPAVIDEIPLYRQIWQEGLATYVSSLLNPNATLGDVLLDPHLASEGPKFVPMAARSLLTQLETTNDETTARYLSYRHGSKTPSRIGYLIGYDIAVHLTATRSVKELSRARGGRLLRLIRTEVRALARTVTARRSRNQIPATARARVTKEKASAIRLPPLSPGFPFRSDA
jgi:hypothetical protein